MHHHSLHTSHSISPYKSHGDRLALTSWSSPCTQRHTARRQLKAENSLGPVENSVGPVENSLGPVENSVGPVENSLGPVENSLGPVEVVQCLANQEVCQFNLVLAGHFVSPTSSQLRTFSLSLSLSLYKYNSIPLVLVLCSYRRVSDYVCGNHVSSS